jgi:nitrite reductase/ring-hydroxylating ferredoxin subunit/DMSO/TMAO reductase YedYZ heme-binding membrane subunit
MVQWNPFKKSFDLILGFGIIGFFLAYFLAASLSLPPGETLTPLQMGIGISGSSSFVLLSLILCLGPLVRLDKRFLGLVYNRRHMGVVCFIVALIHALLVLLWYHGFSDLNPLISLLVSNPRYDSIGGFPFESLGLLALVILFVLASTSHDFFNANLGPKLWKALHMGVYFAYSLIVAHVVLGAMQSARLPNYALFVALSAALVSGLHLLSALKQASYDKAHELESEGWIKVTDAHLITDGRARIITPPRGESIAVFRDGDRFFAIANACKHQGGPLGEGRIIDGCVVCPWHGFQYHAHNGCSPAPFTEKVATYQTRIQDGYLYLNPKPFPEGTELLPSFINGDQPK